MSFGLIVWGLIPSRMSKRTENEANQRPPSSDQFKNQWNFHAICVFMMGTLATGINKRKRDLG
jgi:hypothetical protein